MSRGLETIRVLPSPAIRPYVDSLWYARREIAASAGEVSLPTATAHIVVALHDEPFHWTSAGDESGTWTRAVVHGPQATWYRPGPKVPGIVVGASLRPAAASALFGIAAESLMGRHVPLETLWGIDVERLRRRIADRPGALEAIAEFDRGIARLIRRPLLLHPTTAAALAGAWGPERPFRLRAFALESGFSEKHVIDRFRETVGLTPSRYFRVRRFSEALQAIARGRHRSLAQIAAESGFFDQAHLVRDFQELGGITPSAYRPPDSQSPHHHVPK